MRGPKTDYSGSGRLRRRCADRHRCLQDEKRVEPRSRAVCIRAAEMRFPDELRTHRNGARRDGNVVEGNFLWVSGKVRPGYCNLIIRVESLRPEPVWRDDDLLSRSDGRGDRLSRAFSRGRGRCFGRWNDLALRIVGVISRRCRTTRWLRGRSSDNGLVRAARGEQHHR